MTEVSLQYRLDFQFFNEPEKNPATQTFGVFKPLWMVLQRDVQNLFKGKGYCSVDPLKVVPILL